jgi:hypothetical protein
MRCIDDLMMLYKWAREGWEVHPIVDEEFEGWI